MPAQGPLGGLLRDYCPGLISIDRLMRAGGPVGVCRDGWALSGQGAWLWRGLGKLIRGAVDGILRGGVCQYFQARDESFGEKRVEDSHKLGIKRKPAAPFPRVLFVVFEARARNGGRSAIWGLASSDWPPLLGQFQIPNLLICALYSRKRQQHGMVPEVLKRRRSNESRARANDLFTIDSNPP